MFICRNTCIHNTRVKPDFRVKGWWLGQHELHILSFIKPKRELTERFKVVSLRLIWSSLITSVQIGYSLHMLHSIVPDRSHTG